MQECACLVPAIRRHNVPVANESVFIYQQSVNTDRAAGVGFVRADTDFCAKSIAEAIGKARRGVPEYSGRIHLAEELLRGRWIFRDDGIGVMRSISFDMRNRVVDVIDHMDGHDQ